jgi:hypothetical protein
MAVCEFRLSRRGIIRAIRMQESAVAFLAQEPPISARRATQRRRQAGHSPVTAPLLVFGAVVVAALYVAYVLWPRWPQGPVALNAPSLPIVVSGVTFNVEPAAIRIGVQRRPGVQQRVDLSYLWPSLMPPDPAFKPTVGVPLDANERVFVTLSSGDATLPLIERVKTIYPRYLVPQPVAGFPGLTYRGFRDDSPYQGEDLVFESNAPEHFLARCSRKGVTNSGVCLLERRIGNADITFRFPRDWLPDWENVAKGVDQLVARLHPMN